MRRKSERGEGKLGGLILLVVLLAVALAAWNVGARLPTTTTTSSTRSTRSAGRRRYKAREGDEAIMKMLMNEVRKRRLGHVDRPGELHDHDHAETSRQIQLYYEREVEILPGWKKTFKFNVHRRPAPDLTRALDLTGVSSHRLSASRSRRWRIAARCGT